MELEPKIIQGKHGGKIILLNGHKYTKKRANKNGTILSMCFERNSNCKCGVSMLVKMENCKITTIRGLSDDHKYDANFVKKIQRVKHGTKFNKNL